MKPQPSKYVQIANCKRTRRIEKQYLVWLESTPWLVKQKLQKRPHYSPRSGLQKLPWGMKSGHLGDFVFTSFTIYLWRYAHHHPNRLSQFSRYHYSWPLVASVSGWSPQLPPIYLGLFGSIMTILKYGDYPFTRCRNPVLDSFDQIESNHAGLRRSSTPALSHGGPMSLLAQGAYYALSLWYREFHADYSQRCTSRLHCILCEIQASALLSLAPSIVCEANLMTIRKWTEIEASVGKATSPVTLDWVGAFNMTDHKILISNVS